MSSHKIRTGDDVIVVTGKDRGRRGNVTRILANDKIVVEGINMAKKHVRPDPNAGVQGGIEEKEMPLHVSNVMIYNPQTDKGERVGFKMLDENGRQRKVRVFKSSGEQVDA
ncbi:50S ribosomal protein L24 [Salinisphaera sp. Q1T1-3]|uniref:50S ribosomal protein L24 n=1 Tax=Salinisphaera sp. Q1T1-3 TaxID=2321229 RepID=UPI000E7482E5|nr:50S ribosomal protein L24 [Salinisphaera sp. Q1T1-3]RJS94019.1 50S ribosomal protein L24 [Salinisphaera sp. Q1T1-3]